jgi:hypothetical protein
MKNVKLKIQNGAKKGMENGKTRGRENVKTRKQIGQSLVTSSATIELNGAEKLAAVIDRRYM